MSVNVSVGNKIKQLRLAKGLSQERLAQLAEVDRTYIPGIEKGTRNISLKVLEKISKALNVEMKIFFE